MQRDTYAMLIKKKHITAVDARVEQLNGEITDEKLYSEAFHGIEMRRLVLLTHMRKSLPPHSVPGGGPLLSHDVIVDSEEKLLSLHKPNYVYRLLPLLCSSRAAFSALQGICDSAGSPFTLDDRKDNTPFRKQLFNAADVIENWFRENQTSAALFGGHLPPSMQKPSIPSDGRRQMQLRVIDFDGVLQCKTTSLAALVHVVPNITVDKIFHMSDMVRFVSDKGAYRKVSEPTVVEWMAKVQKFNVVAAEHPVQPALQPVLTDLAAKCAINLYHQVQPGVFQFVPPVPTRR